MNDHTEALDAAYLVLRKYLPAHVAAGVASEILEAIDPAD